MSASTELTLAPPPLEIGAAEEPVRGTTWRQRLTKFGILMRRVDDSRAGGRILAGRTRRRVARHVAGQPAARAGVADPGVATSAQMMWVVVLDRTFYPGGVSSPLNEHIRSAFLRLSDFEVMTYMAILTAGFALEYFRRFREGQFAAGLQTQMVEAQLLALRSQLNPHFLFNALNSVIALMDRDVPAAQRMVARLGELLRLSLGADEAEVPLARELHLVHQYLEIEQIRFGDRLSVTVDVPADLLDVQVPNLVLQPLVENAIVHGVGPRPGPGHVAVRVRRDGDTVSLSVLDNGVGLLRNGSHVGHGIGVGNTRARLSAIYGGNATLTLRQAQGGGCVAEVRLPLEPAAAV